MGGTCEQRLAAVCVGPALSRCRVPGFRCRRVELHAKLALAGLGSQGALSPTGQWKGRDQPAGESGRLREYNGYWKHRHIRVLHGLPKA